MTSQSPRSFAWDKLQKIQSSVSKLKMNKGSPSPKLSPASPGRKKSIRRKSAGIKQLDTNRRKSARRLSRKLSRESRKSEDRERRRSSRGSRKSKDKDLRRSSKSSRKSKDLRKSKSKGSLRKSQRRSQNMATNTRQKKSISKVKVWQNDPKNTPGGKQNANRKSWQAVPPGGSGSQKKKKSKLNLHQGMMEQRRRVTPDTHLFNTVQEEEEDDDSDSDDPLNLPKDPEMYMFQQLPLEPEIKKFRPGCTCNTTARLPCWCKFLAYLETIVGVILIAFKITVMASRPKRQLIEEWTLGVDYSELTAYVLTAVGGIVLSVGAGCRLKFFCLAHTFIITVGMFFLFATIVVYVYVHHVLENREKLDVSKEPPLSGIWWFLIIVKTSWVWLLLWSALMSLLLFFRIRRADRLNVVKPLEFTVSPQTYMSKVEIFLNV